MEKVRGSRWLLAPMSTARMRRRMILWEITSYQRALQLEAERRAEIARLEMAHGRRWRRRASAHERLALKLSAVAPADLLPSLTANIGPEPVLETLEIPEPPAEIPAEISAEPAEGSARTRAAALLAAEPDIPGTELARRLGVTTGYGRRLRSELLNSENGYR
jgi:hypothetical protein